MTKQIRDNVRAEVTKLNKQVQRQQKNISTCEFFGDAKVREIARLNQSKQRLEVLKRIVKS